MYRDLTGLSQPPPILPQSTLEIVPEEDDLVSISTSNNNNNNINDEPFPPPPPPSLLLQQTLSTQHQLHPHSATPPLPPPPPPHHVPSTSSSTQLRRPSSSTGVDASTSAVVGEVSSARVWSAMGSAKDGDDGNSYENNGNTNNAYLRFYLDQVLVNAREVITCVCGLIVLLLMILCLASPDWLLTDKFRQGLWVHCIADDAPTPLPFNLTERGGCFNVRHKGYIQASATLCVLCLLFDVVATAMTAFGLFIKDPGFKRRLYRLAVYIMVGALVNILIALIVYPSCFGMELETSNRRVWEFGWAYGVGWGGAIFLFGAIVLLLCDKNQGEVYYRERTIDHHNNKEFKA
ncbi:hypothetical protein CHUAL_009169 [Chamberlinius hualienensis]